MGADLENYKTFLVQTYKLNIKRKSKQISKIETFVVPDSNLDIENLNIYLCVAQYLLIM